MVSSMNDKYKPNWKQVIREIDLPDRIIAEKVGLHLTRIWKLRNGKGSDVRYENGVKLLKLHKRRQLMKKYEATLDDI